MSEEILKALMQLFAIILKQDGMVSKLQHSRVKAFLMQQISPDQVPEYLGLFEGFADYDPNAAESTEKGGEKKLTSMKDSVRTLGICKKINKTLEQKQKIVVFARILEMISADEAIGELAMEIIETVGKVFKIKGAEYEEIKGFVFEGGVGLNSPHILRASGEEKEESESNNQEKHIFSKDFHGRINFLKVASVELYFLKASAHGLIMNGLPLKENQLYIFPNGSTIKSPSAKSIYYSEVAATYLKDEIDVNVTFNAKDINFVFPKGNIGLRDINISEDTGKLVGIMGASGAGKSTLLNILNGNEAPTSGEVLINGIDVHKEKEKVEGVVGYVPQDDLLIDELTVYQNLYYNGKLCLDNISEEELHDLIIQLLKNLDLLMTKDLKVGNVLEKTISGGQRKRLNIGLELLREPSVLFVDEPTSGLSSRDSENIMDLLKELTLKGKIIFVVIHQPSSDIYKMFDKMFILDVGGYNVYYGNPVEALTFFKEKANQADQNSAECITCGNVNPELIFNIIDAKLVDDYGRHLDKRKVSPMQWNQYFTEDFKFTPVEDAKDTPPNSLFIPSKLKQLGVFIKRDLLSKFKNTQYMMINTLEAPALAIVLAVIVKNAVDSDEYIFFKNENIPAYIFMSIVVALFMGLTISAEEIIKDRRILKREKFLNLSKSSYLFSKVVILFSFSALQAFLFVIFGNTILEIEGLGFQYWLVLFTVGCFANILGLNISASFNSAVTIYILIPLILIPQMILSGAMFNFDKINKILGGENRVPVMAEVMVSRWAYEALAVEQYQNNQFEKSLFSYHKLQSDLDYKLAYFIPELKRKVNLCLTLKNDVSPENKTEFKKQLAILHNAITAENSRLNDEQKYSQADQITVEGFTSEVAMSLKKYLRSLNEFYSEYFSDINDLVDEKKAALFTIDGVDRYTEYKEKYANESLEEIMKNTFSKKKIKVIDGKVEQVIDPIFKSPSKDNVAPRSHFYSHVKRVPFSTMYIPTYTGNIIVIWLMSLFAFIALYFEWLKKLIDALGAIQLPKIKFNFLPKKKEPEPEVKSKKTDRKKSKEEKAGEEAKPERKKLTPEEKAARKAERAKKRAERNKEKE